MESKSMKRKRPIPYNEEDKAFLVDLGRRINYLRTEKKLTQSELANLSGVHKNFICIVENGSQNPSLICLWHISRALDIPLSNLFGNIYEK